jgi:hypothetical protein
VKDGFGNPVSGAMVTVAATGTGNAITQPVGTTNASGQIAGGLSSTVAETKTVTAAVNGAVVISQTASVTVTPGTATVLAFTGQPSNTRQNTAITPAVVVTARDGFGNTATAFTGAVTVSITPGTGTLLATLSGTTSINAAAGVATFSNLSINLIGAGYQLNTAASGLTGATSIAFNITL